MKNNSIFFSRSRDFSKEFKIGKYIKLNNEIAIAIKQTLEANK